MSRLDVVIDLETMSTLPNAAIVSIGAVAVRDRVPWASSTCACSWRRRWTLAA